MLVLTNSLLSSLVVSEWTPKSPTNLAVWLKFNTNITADEANGGTTTYDPVRSTEAGNLTDGDRINAWNAFGATSVNAAQTTSADKPRWETDSADLGALAFPASIKYMNFSADTTIDADTDFSIVMRARLENNDGALLGSSDTEFIRFVDNKTIRININNTQINLAEASDTIATDGTYYTFIFSRTNGATGDINAYVNGGGYSDKDWDAAENATNTNNFVINNLGSKADDSGNLQGFIKDVIVYNGTALTASDKAELYTYLEAQE